VEFLRLHPGQGQKAFLLEEIFEFVSAAAGSKRFFAQAGMSWEFAACGIL